MVKEPAGINVMPSGGGAMVAIALAPAVALALAPAPALAPALAPGPALAVGAEVVDGDGADLPHEVRSSAKTTSVERFGMRAREIYTRRR
jgi:hypothetical protein